MRKVGDAMEKDTIFFANLTGTCCPHVHMHVVCVCASLFSSTYEGF